MLITLTTCLMSFRELDLGSQITMRFSASSNLGGNPTDHSILLFPTCVHTTTASSKYMTT